ncbi:hypothetical protein Hamer_G007816, partial [Homarus americanus]
MMTSRMFVLIAFVLVKKCVGSPVDHVGVMMGIVKGGFAYQVGEVVGQVVELHLTGCHLVLVDTTQNPTFSTTIRQLMRMRTSVTIVEAWRLFSQEEARGNESKRDQLNGDQTVSDRLARNQLLQGLWGDATLTCRALIIYLDNNSSLFFM